MPASALDKAKHFYFDVELEECYKDVEGVPHVVGIASDDLEDRVGDRMSSKAISSMAEQCNKNALPLLDNHKATFGFGKTHAASARRVEVVDKSTGERKWCTQLVVDFSLDMRFPEAHVLFEEVESKKAEKQLSIGGFIPKTKTAVRTEKTADGREVRVIEEILLEHIAATRPKMAAVPRTKFVDAIVKDVFGDEDDEAAVQKDEESTMSKMATKGTPVVNKDQAAQDQAAQTESAQAPAAAPAAAASNAPAEEQKEKVSDEEARDAQKAIKQLAQIGKLFADAPTEKGKDPVPAEIEALQAAADKCSKEIVGKSMDTVRNIHRALGTLLGEKDTAEPAAEGASTDAAAAAQPAPLDTDAVKDVIKSVVTDVVKEQLAAVLEATKAQGETVKSAMDNLTTEIVKGLESMATGFKGFVETKTSSIEAMQKSADDRLNRLEKAAGTVRQSTPGAESSVAKGDVPAQSGTEVTKTTGGGGKTPARTPTPENPWRGFFDGAANKHLAARGGRRA